jgi:hypothetical protein
MNDNFDLRKFLVESKSIENMNPIFRKLNENKGKTTKTIKTTKTPTTITENNLRAKIREIVLNELGGGEDYDLESRRQEHGINPEIDNEERDSSDAHEYFFDIDEDDDLYEAKKDKEEDMPADDEEIDLELEPEMDAPEDALTAAASGATGDAKELINHLMTSLDTAKTIGNEKLTTQILNTLKFAIDQSMAQ